MPISWSNMNEGIFQMRLTFRSDFPSGSVVKNLPAEQETWVQSLGREDPLEKEMANHSSILGWEISRTEERSRLQSLRRQGSWIR